MKKIFERIKKEVVNYRALLRDFPPLTLTLFVLSIVAANLMAGKELVCYKYLSLDCGVVFSWIMFLTSDVICKYYGARATVRVSILALFLNLLLTFSFFIVAKIGGNWAAFYVNNDKGVNAIINSVFSLSPYIVLGSSTAFIVSSVINAYLNSKIGGKMKKDTFGSFAARSYLSTFISQFFDNFIFSVIVSRTLFSWNLVQITMCSLTGGAVEMACEVVFSPLGYKIVKRWEKEKIGKGGVNESVSYGK